MSIKLSDLVYILIEIVGNSSETKLQMGTI